MSALRWVESQSSAGPGKMCFTALRLKNCSVLCALQHIKHLQQRQKCSLLHPLYHQDPTNQILLLFLFLQWCFVSRRNGFAGKRFPVHGFIRNFRSLRQLMCCRVTKNCFHGSGQKSKIDATRVIGENELSFPRVISRNRRACRWEQCPDFCPAAEAASVLTHTNTHLGST